MNKRSQGEPDDLCGNTPSAMSAGRDDGGSVACKRWPSGLCPECGYSGCRLAAAEQARRDVAEIMESALPLLSLGLARLSPEPLWDQRAFARLLRFAMAEAGCNQKAVALAAGVQESALSRILSKRPYGPGVETYLRLRAWLTGMAPAFADAPRSGVTETGRGPDPGAHHD